MFLLSPLEQFQILPLIHLRFGNIDFSFTNANLIILIALGAYLILIKKILSPKETFYLVPSRWQIVIETFYNTISNMLADNLGTRGQQYICFIIKFNRFNSLQFHFNKSFNSYFCFSFNGFCWCK